ncbi:ankyrin repeat-containing domain protein [Thelonectria olida]|uniref:Ankyrin repeat-containing domain protein n=1 Tax=Thelonectria olida TaxID=1576542 RepID=A0A9P9AK42_9HYPO|nr:ankyrin repeat-containing domain protein [Thelonectria olida]
MAEVLGVVGSVIGIIQLTASLAKGVTSLIQGIRDAPNDISHIHNDVVSLALVLGVAGNLFERHTPDEAPSQTKTLTGYLQMCQTSLQEIQTFLEPLIQQGSGGRKLIQRVEWNIRKRELRGLQEKLSDGKAGLTLTITTLSAFFYGERLDEIKSEIHRGFRRLAGDFKDEPTGDQVLKRAEEDVDNDSVRDGGTSASHASDDAPRVMPSLVQSPVAHRTIRGPESISSSTTLDVPDDLFQMDNPDAMLEAVRGQNKQLVRALVSRGVGLTARSAVGYTVLHHCALDNDVEMGDLLIRNGARMDVKDFQLRSPLKLALRLGHVEFATLLIDNGCHAGDCIKELQQLTPEVEETHGQTELFRSLSRNLTPAEQSQLVHPVIQSGDLNRLAMFVNLGFDPCMRDKSGLSLFFYALLHEKDSIMRFLASHGADLNEWLPRSAVGDLDPNLPKQQKIQSRTPKGTTPLMVAAYIVQDVRMTKFLLELGADPNFVLTHRNNEVVLISLCGRQFLDIAKELVKGGTDPNRAGNDGRSAMYWALFCSNWDLVKLLIECGGNVSYQWTHDGTTAVMMAASRGNVEVVQLLVKSGADIGVRNKNGETALDVAKRIDNKKVVDFLQGYDDQAAGLSS